jgi:multidrug efflux pump subunit AcrA (membrane-fusion protein)
MKRWLWVLIGCLVLGFLGPATYVVGNHLRHTSATVARKLGTPLPVRVAVAKQANLTQTIGASGEVQPMANLDLTEDQNISGVHQGCAPRAETEARPDRLYAL